MRAILFVLTLSMAVFGSVEVPFRNAGTGPNFGFDTVFYQDYRHIDIDSTYALSWGTIMSQSNVSLSTYEWSTVNIRISDSIYHFDRWDTTRSNYNEYDYGEHMHSNMIIKIPSDQTPISYAIGRIDYGDGGGPRSVDSLTELIRVWNQSNTRGVVEYVKAVNQDFDTIVYHTRTWYDSWNSWPYAWFHASDTNFTSSLGSGMVERIDMSVEILPFINDVVDVKPRMVMTRSQLTSIYYDALGRKAIRRPRDWAQIVFKKVR